MQRLASLSVWFMTYLFSFLFRLIVQLVLWIAMGTREVSKKAPLPQLVKFGKAFKLVTHIQTHMLFVSHIFFLKWKKVFCWNKVCISANYACMKHIRNSKFLSCSKQHNKLTFTLKFLLIYSFVLCSKNIYTQYAAEADFIVIINSSICSQLNNL